MSAAAFVVVGAIAPAMLHAQAQPAASRTVAANLTVATPHRTPADTGRMAWGHQDFSAYTSAAPCDRAMMHVAAEVWRVHVLDTLPYAVETDTMPSAAVAVAHACGDRFTPATADPRDWWSVQRLALATGNMSAVHEVTTRALAAAKTPEARAAALLWSIQNELNVHPPRFEIARALLRQLDGLGDGVRSYRYEGHSLLLRYWHMVYNVDSLRNEANAMRTLVLAMTPRDRDQVDAMRPYNELLWLARDTRDLSADRTLIDLGLSEIGGWRDGRGSDLFLFQENLLKTLTSVLGKPTRAMHGAYMFNEQGAAHPTPGVVSLIVHVDHRCDVQCFPLYALLRRMKAQYGSALDLTLLAETHGFAPGTGPVPADSEATLVSRYFLDFLKLPAALMIDSSRRSIGEDGHVKYGGSPIGNMFNEWRLVNAILVDRDGKVQWVGALGSAEDAKMLGQLIDRASKPRDTAAR